MSTISKTVSKNAKATCGAIANSCELAKIPKSAKENFSRKPYYSVYSKPKVEK